VKVLALRKKTVRKRRLAKNGLDGKGDAGTILAISFP